MEKDEIKHTARFLRFALRVFGFGLVMLLIVSFQHPEPASVFATASVAVLSALMCFAVGAFLGLLFGVPRHNKADNDTAAIVPNNNLEQVSDWLTKMIVGITLVQFGTIVQKVKIVARQINDAMLGCPPQCVDNYAMGLAVIGFFAVLGFLMMYLWSRIYLLDEASDLDDRMSRRTRDLLNKLDKASARQLRPDEGRPGSTGILRNSMAFIWSRISAGAKEVDSGVEPAVRLVGSTTEKPGQDADDPWKGVFGGKSRSNGRELAAEIRPLPNSEYCQIRLTVRPVDTDKLLQGAVTFFLHDTFPDPVREVAVQDGRASLMVAAWGAFTVGAIADGGETRLELNLARNPDAPEDWRWR